MRVILLLLLIQSSLAQENQYRCDCAFFAQSQIDDDYFFDESALPLHATFADIDPNACTFPEGGINPCKSYCQTWGEGIVGNGFNYCNATPAYTDRCYGGLFCEGLFNQGFQEIQDEAVRLFYRMTECPDAHREWVDCAFQLPTALCCEQGLFKSCYDIIDCTCNKANTRRYCECGVFIPEQLDDSNGLTAIPLAYIGNLTDPEDSVFYCLQFGGISCPCRSECADSGTTFLQTSLNANPPFSGSQTYGDLYCAAFKSRSVFFQGVNSKLAVYQRAPECDTLEWLQVPGVEDDERFCCDDDGRHLYPCQEP